MKYQEVLLALAAACVAAGATARVTEPSPENTSSDPRGRLIVDDEDVTSFVDLRTVRAGGGDLYSREPRRVVRYRVVVSTGYVRGSQRVQIPYNKGDYRWSEGVSLLRSVARAEKASRQRDANRRGHTDAVAALRAELGLSSWGPLRLEPSPTDSKPVAYELKLSGYATPDEVRALAAALAGLGVKLT